jgi:hypothetical protein
MARQHGFLLAFSRTRAPHLRGYSKKNFARVLQLYMDTAHDHAFSNAIKPQISPRTYGFGHPAVIEGQLSNGLVLYFSMVVFQQL